MFWIPLESNPEVMNKFLVQLGVPSKIHVVDVLSLEPDLLGIVPQPVLALLLLFPYDEKYEEYKSKQEEELKLRGQIVSSKLYFLKQYIQNACGTIALIHSIANIDNIELEDGCLKEFLAKSKSLTPDERGSLLQKSEPIGHTHKSVASEGQTSPPAASESATYHFIAFVQKEGSLYELDGRKAFPINHGPSSPETFLEDAAKTCRNYMARNPDNVNFTVIAVTAD